MYVYRIQKAIGGYYAAMTRTDAVVMTAGIGENSADLRERIFAGLAHMGMILDKERNDVTGQIGMNRIISIDDSPIKICVVTTDEEMRIARETDNLVSQMLMNTAPVHAIEHLGATFLRNDPEWGPRDVYFGPMGCRTGFYLVLFGDYAPMDIADLVKRMYQFIADFEGDIPGAAPAECGNWHDSDLNAAKWWARRYLDQTLSCLDEAHTTYPQA